MIIFIYFINECSMAKDVLFDLGDTLETLERIKNMDNPPILGLASDYGLPNN